MEKTDRSSNQEGIYRAVHNAEAESARTASAEDVCTSATLCFAGDIVQNMPLNHDAYSRNGSYDFTYVYDYARKYLEAADYSACCIETTLNSANQELSGYPRFCSPDEVAVSLKAVGIDLIATASNHANDTYKQGIDRTIQVLDELGIDHVGTYATAEERDKNRGILLKNINGISIAFLNYTFTNNVRIEDYSYAVNEFTSFWTDDYSEIDYALLRADMEHARAMKPDIIVIMLHWGVENSTEPEPLQKELAELLFKEGADIIIGGHPHVPQPIELREVDRGDGSTRTAFLAYSLGNFLSNQNKTTVGFDYTDLTALVNLRISKNISKNETVITGIDYVPMHLIFPNESKTGHYCLLDINRAMEEYENASSRYLTAQEYEKLKTALDDCHRLFNENEIIL